MRQVRLRTRGDSRRSSAPLMTPSRAEIIVFGAATLVILTGGAGLLLYSGRAPLLLVVGGLSVVGTLCVVWLFRVPRRP